MTPYRHGMWVLAATLSGCLASEEPLIGDADSVAPLADGTYVYVDDGSEREVVVSHYGGVTRMVSVETSDESEMRMARIRRGYYVAMSQEGDDYSYTLMRIERRRFTLYETEGNCRRLQELWVVGGKTPADVGIAAIEGSAVATCVLTSYGDLERAFQDLLADGRIKPALVFARQ